MMKTVRTSVALLLLIGIFLFLNQSAASPPPAGMPFMDRQVAVYAEPQQLSGYRIIKYLPNAGITIVEAQSGKEWGQVQQFRKWGLRGGLNLKAKAFATSNDPFAAYQWNFNSVQAPQVWDSTDGAGVTVAILDTGLAETGAADGIGCVVMPYDIVNGDSVPEDGNGHGTHVAGTVSQASNNGIGVAGLAYGACVMPVKVLADNGSGTFADIADGIYYAVDHGAQVINLSLGTNARYSLANDPIVDPALDYAYQHGTTVVCAAGNDAYWRNVSYPAIYPSTIAVGATDFTNRVTRYSNRGTGLDLVAPGGNTSVDANRDGYGDGILQETKNDGSWGYYFYQGTSMSAPHVAAAAALLISGGTASLPDAVKDRLASTALDIENSGFDSVSGFGLIQIYSALTYSTTQPPVLSCIDADGDGWCAIDDCDDANPLVNPGASDPRGWRNRDGIDNDCDGIVDW